jgi:hypothetical protein
VGRRRRTCEPTTSASSLGRAKLAVPLGLRPLGTVFGFLHGHVLDEMRELVEKPDETDLLRLGLHRLPIGDFPCSAAWRPSWPPMTAPPSSNAASASG